VSFFLYIWVQTQVNRGIKARIICETLTEESDYHTERVKTVKRGCPAGCADLMLGVTESTGLAVDFPALQSQFWLQS